MLNTEILTLNLYLAVSFVVGLVMRRFDLILYSLKIRLLLGLPHECIRGDLFHIAECKLPAGNIFKTPLLIRLNLLF